MLLGTPQVFQLKDIVESKRNKRIALQFALLTSGIELPDFSELVSRMASCTLARASKGMPKS